MPSPEQKVISVEEASRISQEKDTIEINNLRERLIELEKRAKNVDFAVDVGKVIIIGVIIVFFVSFMALAIDVWRFHTTTYKEYRDTVQSLKDEVDKTKEQQITDKLQQMQQEVDNLWKNKYPIRK